MKILLSGGYTLGPVTPLLAIAEKYRKKYPDTEFVWIGTKTGPEKQIIEESGIKFFSISSGKLRRYLSIKNLFDLVKIKIGFFQSLKILWREKPNLCISAGGFVSLPVHFAAWLYGIPTWIHQQDIKVGLANRLMAPLAKVITTALKQNVKDFSKKKTHWIGNPIRESVLQADNETALKKFNLKKDLPVVFAMGGGTGSLRVNQLIVQAVQHLEGHAQIIHLSGKDRPQELVERAVKHFDYYQVHQFFITEMSDAYSVADIVVSRGGFGSLSEISAWEKPAILIPKPGHQEDNVKFLADAGAVLLIDEKTADGNLLAKMIKDLLADTVKQKQMSKLIQNMLPIAKDEDILEIVEWLVK